MNWWQWMIAIVAFLLAWALGPFSTGTFFLLVVGVAGFHFAGRLTGSARTTLTIVVVLIVGWGLGRDFVEWLRSGAVGHATPNAVDERAAGFGRNATELFSQSEVTAQEAYAGVTDSAIVRLTKEVESLSRKPYEEAAPAIDSLIQRIVELRRDRARVVSDPGRDSRQWYVIQWWEDGKQVGIKSSWLAYGKVSPDTLDLDYQIKGDMWGRITGSPTDSGYSAKWRWAGGTFGGGELKKVAPETYHGKSPGTVGGKSVTFNAMIVRTEGKKKGLLRRAVGVLF